MNRDNPDPGRMIDRAIEEIQNETIDPGAVERAAQRAWARISQELKPGSVETIRGCEDFQVLLPAYRAGKLSEARALLVKDHLHECIACRKAFMAQPAKEVRSKEWRRPIFRIPQWAMAAAAALVVVLAGWELFNRFGPPPAGPAAKVQTLDGPLFRISGAEAVPVAAGGEIVAGELVRTANGSGVMLRLRDGSLVEVREHSDFQIAETRRDVTIRLAHGSVIVEAAKRSSGHLYVSTRDCRVAVTGTIFSVNSGVKGSRVSVIEGEVQVAQGSREAVLHPGQQYSSNPRLTPVPVAQEIAWSRNAEAHLELLKELVALGAAIDQRVQMPGARYSSRLLDYLPARTALYVALPNLGETLVEAHRVFQERVSQSPVLSEWWSQKGGSDGKLEQLVDEIRLFSAYLGDEIVVAAALNSEGKLGDPFLLAEVRQSGFPEFVRAELGKFGETTVSVFDSAAAITPGTGKELLMYTRSGVVAVSPKADSLREVAQAIEGTAVASFTGTTFHAKIAEAYAGGAGLLFCTDLEPLLANEKDSRILGNVKYLVLGQKQVNGTPDTRALVSFSGPRSGIASWLAAPSPIGALDFVTPDAAIVSAAAVRQPAMVLDELLAAEPKLRDGLARAEADLGLSIRDDLAAAFGAEFAFALDGPVIPVPSWKLIAEVYYPDMLQSTFQKVIDAANRKAAEFGRQGPQLSQEVVGGRTYYTIAMPDAKAMREVHYVFVDGYLIVAPSRVLLDKAIEARAAGATLVSSAEFASLLPKDGYANFSAMGYYNVGSAVERVAGFLSEEQRAALTGIEALMQPTLVMAYGDEDRIAVASTSQSLAITPGNFFGLRTPMTLFGFLGHTAGAVSQ